MRTKVMKLQIENSRENWLMYLQDLVNNVEDVESLEDRQNPFFKDDRTTTLNGERCYSISNDDTIDSIILNVEEPRDNQVDVLWNIVEYTEENYKVDILEDVKC